MPGKRLEDRHGMCNSPEYRCWGNMKRRCYNPKHPEYKRYGARGIRVCIRWLADFRHFLADMGYRPSSKHTIERRDNANDYTPDNCYWAKPKAQARNRRSNRSITFNGRTMILADWAAEIGVSSMCLWYRIKQGWPLEKVLTSPSGTEHVNHREAQRHRTTHITLNGVTKSLPEWAQNLGVSESMLRGRYRQGLPVEEILNTTPRNKIGCRNRKNTRLITWNDETRPLTEWAELVGIGSDTIAYRLSNGWTTEKALTTPVKRRSSH